MLSTKKIVGIFFIVCLVTDLFFITKLCVTLFKQINPLSKFRIIVFIIVHLFSIIMVAKQFIIESIQQEQSPFIRLVNWFMQLCFPICVVVTLTQLTIFLIYGNGKLQEDLKSSSFAELSFLHFYFLIYMNSIIGTFLCAIYFCVSKVIQVQQAAKLEEILQKNLFQVKYSQQLMQKQCSICQFHFKQNKQNIIKLRCNHFFHKQCIIPWIKKSQEPACPNCRAVLSDAPPPPQFQFQI